MADKPRLPSILFWLDLLAAAALVGLVLVAPWLAPGPVADGGAARALGLFAHDTAVRRVSLFAAVGLTVSACVFFRPEATRPGQAPPGS
jgi:hypothetical protein